MNLKGIMLKQKEGNHIYDSIKQNRKQIIEKLKIKS